MNDLTKTLTVLAIFAALGVGTVAYLTFDGPARPAIVGSSNANTFFTATNSSSSVSSSATQILAANGSRTYLGCTNDGGNVAYLSLKSTSTGVTAATGIRLNASGGSFELSNQNLYLGALQAVTLTGTTSITCAEAP